MGRSIHLRFGKPPSGLACYPRVVLTSRQPVTEVNDPPEFRAHIERVRLDRGEIAKYAQVCGFPASADVPSTYPHVVAMPLHLKIFATEAFPLRPMGLLHVSNRIELFGEIRPDVDYTVDVALRSYRKTDAGIEFDLDSELKRAGRLLWSETCVFLSRWPGGKERPSARPPRPPKAPQNARVLDEFEVSLKTAWDYARVSNDYNPIHLSDRAARWLGLRGAISHGMWSLARSLACEPGMGPKPGARLDTQFLTPVQLPARVTVKQWDEGGAPRRALCDLRTGKVHMYAQWQA